MQQTGATRKLSKLSPLWYQLVCQSLCRLCALCWAAGLLTSRRRSTRQAGARSSGCLDSLILCLGTFLVGFATKKQHHEARHRDEEISNCAEFTNSEAISWKTRSWVCICWPQKKSSSFEYLDSGSSCCSDCLLAAQAMCMCSQSHALPDT